MKNLIIIRGICSALLLITCSACSFTLSNKLPYSSYMNKPLTLKRDVWLYDLKSGPVTFWSGGRHLKPGELYLMTETPTVWDSMTQEYYDKVKTASGAELTIHKIYYFQSDAGYDVRVLGEVYLESVKKNVPFIYHWPLKDHDILPAPWDNETAMITK